MVKYTSTISIRLFRLLRLVTSGNIHRNVTNLKVHVIVISTLRRGKCTISRRLTLFPRPGITRTRTGKSMLNLPLRRRNMRMELLHVPRGKVNRINRLTINVVSNMIIRQRQG